MKKQPAATTAAGGKGEKFLPVFKGSYADQMLQCNRVVLEKRGFVPLPTPTGERDRYLMEERVLTMCLDAVNRKNASYYGTAHYWDMAGFTHWTEQVYSEPHRWNKK